MNASNPDDKSETEHEQTTLSGFEQGDEVTVEYTVGYNGTRQTITGEVVVKFEGVATHAVVDGDNGVRYAVDEGEVRRKTDDGFEDVSAPQPHVIVRPVDEVEAGDQVRVTATVEGERHTQTGEVVEAGETVRVATASAAGEVVVNEESGTVRGYHSGEGVAEGVLGTDATVERINDGDGYLGAFDDEADERPEDGAVVITDGGEDAEGCPHGHPNCEGVDADAERPELCFDCWDVWAEYEPTLLGEDEEHTTDDSAASQAPQGPTCAIGTCDGEPTEGARDGLCEDHADGAEGVDFGEAIMTDGGTLMAPRVEDVDVGAVIDLPANGGTWEVTDVDKGAWYSVTSYEAERLDGEAADSWPEHALQKAFEAGARIVGGDV